MTPLPTLLSFDAEQMKMKRLEEENSKLQDQVSLRGGASCIENVSERK